MTADGSRAGSDNRRAAFLLIIPGCVAIGAGLGLALSKLLVGTITGAGAGLLLWGLIVAFRRPGRPND
ncbi:MAG TPA: hypothetical protein VMB50_19535 [Myxococcales bacterium]|nr:hypothetical protein [Myxococcales bacterium]